VPEGGRGRRWWLPGPGRRPSSRRPPRPHCLACLLGEVGLGNGVPSAVGEGGDRRPVSGRGVARPDPLECGEGVREPGLGPAPFGDLPTIRVGDLQADRAGPATPASDARTTRPGHRGRPRPAWGRREHRSAGHPRRPGGRRAVCRRHHRRWPCRDHMRGHPGLTVIAGQAPSCPSYAPDRAVRRAWKATTHLILNGSLVATPAGRPAVTDGGLYSALSDEGLPTCAPHPP
jgi:hypothetical protein